MFEVPPPGFSTPIPAYLKIAHANWPDRFSEADPLDYPDDYYAALLYCAFRQPDALKGDVTDFDAVLAVGKALKSVRNSLSSGQIAAYYLDENANAVLISNSRHWATDQGLEDLLNGEYLSLSDLKLHKILIENAAISAFTPKVEAEVRKPTSAKGRLAFADRLRRYFKDNPEPERSKLEIWDLLEPGSLSKDTKQAVWKEVAQDFPAYTRPGPRRRPSREAG